MDDTPRTAVDLRIWGKSRGLSKPYPLLWHMVDTAVVAGVLWDRFLTVGQRRIIADGLGVEENHAKTLVMLWASLHDLGKATPGFQAKNPDAFHHLVHDPLYGSDGTQEVRHDKASQLTLLRLLKARGYAATGVTTSQSCYRVAQILGGHHGRFCQAKRFDPDMRRLGGSGWEAQRAAITDTLEQALGSPKPPTMIGDSAAVLISGLVILADWLASQEDFLSQQLPLLPQAATIEIVAERIRALQPAAHALLDDAGLGLATFRNARFEEIFPFPPNALQQSILEELLPSLNGPGLLLVTAATGDGKTEAALTAARAMADASGSNGFYFALPTMATADQMYQRVRRFAAQTAIGPVPVTLLHSMSWLNAAYEAHSAIRVGNEQRILSEEYDTQIEVPNWLRGRKRGLLAPLAVGTIDQALIAAMTTKHNVLRLLGLSGKVFIVDEAHAYDDYMQRVLSTLLTWLGAFQCPVVLLSATIPASQAEKLISAYQRGAGSTATVPPRIKYPGWTYVPTTAGRSAITISAEAQAALTVGQDKALILDVRPVRHLDGSEADQLDRRAVIRSVVAPLLDDRGYVAVICNTVADAQLTYEMLRGWAPEHVEIVLLHSRFPAYRREEITEGITRRLGKDGERSGALIVVATQVVEQSLDLDFDLVISDLAPLAQLLQRAGRCHRHTHPRPAWAEEPRLVVLDPHDQTGYRVPPQWGDVYAPYLLRATHQRIAGLDRIEVPGDVQAHMEAVYGPPLVDDPDLAAEYTEYRGKSIAQRQLADLTMIPEAGNVSDLSRLTEGDVPEARAATRLGAESVRVVCCYVDSDGNQWLDPNQRIPLPTPHAHTGRLSSACVKQVLRRSIPVRASVIAGYEPDMALPPGWADSPWLSDIRPLWFTLESRGPLPIRLGRRHLYLDEQLGLVVRAVSDED